MIKRILVPLDPSPYAKAALHFACHLATHHHAEISALAVVDTPGIEKAVGPTPVGGIYFAERQVAAQEGRVIQRVRTLMDDFRSRCEAYQVMHSEVERQATPLRAILELSHFYDCIVMGLRTYFAFSDDAGKDEIYGTPDDHPGDTFDKVVENAAVPVLAVPKEWQVPQGRNRALIAFDGSAPSSRALHDFAHMFSPTNVEVTVVTSCDDIAKGKHLLDGVESYLRAFGFTSLQKEWTSVDIRQAIMENQFLQGADLIVLGAHTKGGLLDFMTSSLCKDLIAEAEKPLLIAH